MRPGICFSRFPGARVDGREFAGAGARKGRDRGGQRTAPRPEGLTAAVDSGGAWAPGLALAREDFYGKLDEKIQSDRHHGHQRQDHHELSGRFDSARGGQDDDAGGHHRVPSGLEGPARRRTRRRNRSICTGCWRNWTRWAATAAPRWKFRRTRWLWAASTGCSFHTAVFTNLTQRPSGFSPHDGRVFRRQATAVYGLGRTAAAVCRDQSRRRMGPEAGAARQTDPKCSGTGSGSDAMVRARHIQSGLNGLRFEVAFDKAAIRDPFAADRKNQRLQHSRGLLRRDDVSVAAGDNRARHRSLPGVPGRFERVDEGQPFAVVVDYSHTDDALRNAISVARSLDAEARDHVVWLRRRPRPDQAAADGAGGGRTERSGDSDQRQSALGRSAADHERCAGRAAPHRYADDRGAGPRGGDSQGD